MAQKTAAKVEEEVEMTLEDLYAGFSQEELAEFFDTTGQAANLRERTPVLKVNYCDIADKTGREIKKGNFVLSQDTSEIEIDVKDEEGNITKELRVEDIGIDLGKTPSITVLTYGFRYSYFPKDKDKKKICSSQIVFDSRKEAALGNNLGFECRSKEKVCPRRAEGVERDDRCGCQWVVFCEVPMPDGTREKAIMYVKGDSYMPFQDYVKSVGVTPIFFAPTKLSTKMEREGSVTYYIIGFEFLKNKPYPVLDIKANGALAKATREGAQLYQQQLKSAPKQQQLAAKSSVGTVSDDVTEIEFD